MDTLAELLKKHQYALAAGQNGRCIGFNIQAFRIKKCYNQAYLANLNGDTAWRDEILTFTHTKF